jgi:isopentenyl-diphosphate delta-isomerase
MPEVILVNEHDEELGSMEKLEAHIQGKLHRAFSVLVFNARQELLLQRRAFGKYHSEGLWTNTCCSHPQPGETLLHAAHRRLNEEMGLHTELQAKFYFIYRAELDNNLIEHELDHVLIGFSQEEPNINEDEVLEYKWMALSEIEKDIAANPSNYTAWFKTIINEHLTAIQPN